MEKARWAAVRSTIASWAQGAADGTIDAEGIQASANQLQQIDIDMQRVRDSIHIPEDAGQYGAALVAMMLRIPDNWGRWISCNPGWYPMITELDAALASLDANYVIHQVKEKFGTLRYYAHTESTTVRAQFDALIRAAEEKSATICERCGQPGQLCSTPTRWRKTLCPDCITTIETEIGKQYRPVIETGD